MLKRSLYLLCVLVWVFACSNKQPTNTGRIGSYVTGIQLAGDLGNTNAAPRVLSASGPSPIQIKPSNGSAVISADTTGAVIGNTSSSQRGLRIAPLIGQETSFVALWAAADAVSPNSGNYTFAFSGSGGTQYWQAGTVNLLATVALTLGGGATTSVMLNGAVGGTSTVPFNFAANAAIAIGAGGTFTLSGAQAGKPTTPLTGALGSNNAIVVVPNSSGHYEFDLSGLTSTTGTLQFQSGSGTCPAQAIGASLVNTLAIVSANPRGTNTIACNY